MVVLMLFRNLYEKYILLVEKNFILLCGIKNLTQSCAMIMLRIMLDTLGTQRFLFSCSWMSFLFLLSIHNAWTTFTGKISTKNITMILRALWTMSALEWFVIMLTWTVSMPLCVLLLTESLPAHFMFLVKKFPYRKDISLFFSKIFDGDVTPSCGNSIKIPLLIKRGLFLISQITFSSTKKSTTDTT